jgi:S-adenosylmethionine hydrolase
MRRATPIVTLSTDAGALYAAQMKGVLCASVPRLQLVDLDLELPPFDVVAAALAVRAMGERFPPGTVHLVIVDPGVGGLRAPIAVQTNDGSFLVGPDNGVLDPLARSLGIDSVVRIDPRRIVSPGTVSPTFEGRDLFAPAAALLAQGTPLRALGDPARRRPLRLPRPRRSAGGWTGTILLIDRFGNLITNIPGADSPPLGTRVHGTIGGREAPSALPRVRTYSDLDRGALGLLVSSFGLVEIAAREGSAAVLWPARTGDKVELQPEKRRRGHRK